MHIGSLHLFRVPARQRATFPERVRGHVAGRLHLVPVFTRRIASLPFGVASPVWIEDREVDLDHHIRRARLPKPGTMAQLEALLDDSPRGRKIPPPSARVLEATPGMGDLLQAAVAKSVEEYGKFLRAMPDAARVVTGGRAALPPRESRHAPRRPSRAPGGDPRLGRQREVDHDPGEGHHSHGPARDRRAVGDRGHRARLRLRAGREGVPAAREPGRLQRARAAGAALPCRRAHAFLVAGALYDAHEELDKIRG